MSGKGTDAASIAATICMSALASAAFDWLPPFVSSLPPIASVSKNATVLWGCRTWWHRFQSVFKIGRFEH